MKQDEAESVEAEPVDEVQLSLLRRARRVMRRTRRVMRRTIRYTIRIPVGLALTLLTFLVPRRSDRMVVIPRKGTVYDGNIKAWHLYVAAQRGAEVATLVADRRVVKQLRQQGVPAVAHPSLESFWELLRARHVFVESTWWGNQFRGILTRGAVRWQLWHGNGIKAVSLANPSVQDKLAGGAGIMKRLLYGRPDHTDVALFASEGQRATRAESFGAKYNVVTGQTRDTFIVPSRPDVPGLMVGVDVDAHRRLEAARTAGSRIVLYAPTWRSRKQLSPWIALDWERMSAFLEEIDAVLVVKAHAKDRKVLPAAAAPSLGARVIVVDPRSDLGPFLIASDVMVTDYSSVFADFLLLDRPVVFFRYDGDSYGEHRAVNGSDQTPGVVVRSNDALRDGIRGALTTDPDAAQRRAFAADFVELPDGLACERLLSLVRDWNAGRRPAGGRPPEALATARPAQEERPRA